MTEYLTIDELAAEFKVSPLTVRDWRKKGTGPRAFKMGHAVRYTREDVGAWIKANNPNGEPKDQDDYTRAEYELAIALIDSFISSVKLDGIEIHDCYTASDGEEFGLAEFRGSLSEALMELDAFGVDRISDVVQP